MKRLLACLMLLVLGLSLLSAQAEETAAYEPIQYGDQGDMVVMIQERLKAVRCYKDRG